MNKLLALLTISLATACTSKADKMLNEVEAFKDKMCECKDKACVDAVQDEMIGWSQNMKELGIDELSDSQKARGKEIDAAMKKCRREARKH